MVPLQDDEQPNSPINSNQFLHTKLSLSLHHPLIINILFIVGGLLFLSRIIQKNQSFNYIFLPVVAILILFTLLTKPTLTEKDSYSTLAFGIWILLAFILTIQAEPEILFILILIGYLIIQELSQDQLTYRFQKRLNIILVFFLIIFVIIVADKIQLILTS